MSHVKEDGIRNLVRDRYAGIANSAKSGCCGEGAQEASSSGCCCNESGSDLAVTPESSLQIGYSAQEISSVPEGANMGLGCGNPSAIASLKPGETVLDLGCGGGFDLFLVARQVGPAGKAIGVDMTPAMVSKARANVHNGGYENVEIRLGEIEHLPVADSSVDVIISNCVINLSPDKSAVFSDAFRVLRRRGRLAISDVVAIKPMTDQIKQNMDTYAGCVGGAALVAELERMLLAVGFGEIKVAVKMESDSFIKDWFPGSGIEEYIRSAVITAVKP